MRVGESITCKYMFSSNVYHGVIIEVSDSWIYIKTSSGGKGFRREFLEVA